MKLKKFNALFKDFIKEKKGTNTYDIEGDDDSEDSEYSGEDDEENMYEDLPDWENEPTTKNWKHDITDAYEEEEYEEEEVSRHKSTSKTKKEMSDQDKDDVEHLAYLLRKMITTSSIDNFYVTTNMYDLSIQFVLNKTETFKSVMKVLGLLKRISTDLLIQYESELDLWETKEGYPLITVDFYFDAKKDGKSEGSPF